MQISVTKTDSMAIRSCGKRQQWRYSVRSFSWAQSNGTGQEFGFALVGKLCWSDAVPPISLHRDRLGGLLWRLRNQ